MGVVTAQQKAEMGRFDIQILNYFIRKIDEKCWAMMQEPHELIEDVREFVAESILGGNYVLPKTISELENNLTFNLDVMAGKAMRLESGEREQILHLETITRAIVEDSLAETKLYQNQQFPGGRIIPSKADRSIPSDQQIERERFNLTVASVFTREVYHHCQELIEDGRPQTARAVRTFFARSLLKDNFQYPLTMEELKIKVMNLVDASIDRMANMPERAQQITDGIFPSMRLIAESAIEKAEEYQNHNHPLIKRP